MPPPPQVPRLARVAALRTLAVPSHGSWFTARPGGVANPPDGDCLLNDELGCCVPVAVWRWIQARRAAEGRPLKIDKTWVAARYRMTGDWIEGNPATDNGTDTARDMLNWTAAPIIVPDDGTEIMIDWAVVPPHADNEIAQALSQGAVLATFNLPASRADDLAAWGYPSDNEPGTVGHRVLIGAWDGRERRARSWGEDTVSPSIHPDFWDAYCVAVDVPVPTAGLANLAFAGMDFTALAAAMAAVRALPEGAA